MLNYTIYLHRNKINNKVYVGQTCQSLEKRWNDGKGYKTSPHFYSAIEKYGWDNFEHEILQSGLLADEADRLEKYYISFYNSQNPLYGYNILSGGNDKLTEYWKDEDNRILQSERRKEYLQDHPDVCETMVKRLQSAYDAKKHSELMKNNYPQSTLYAINEIRKKAIICVETGEVFNSLSEASKKYNISVGNLSMAVSGKRKTAGGFHWKNKESMS